MEELNVLLLFFISFVYSSLIGFDSIFNAACFQNVYLAGPCRRQYNSYTCWGNPQRTQKFKPIITIVIEFFLVDLKMGEISPNSIKIMSVYFGCPKCPVNILCYAEQFAQ